MKKEEYQKLVNSKKPKEPKFKNGLMAFLAGGLVGLIGEVTVNIVMNSFGLAKVDAYSWLCFLIIFLGTLLTAIGIFDNWVKVARCGLIIPTTGFAHSVQSAALDFKKDGYITGIGANVFKLAGSVILYGVISSFFLVLVSVIING